MEDRTRRLEGFVGQWADAEQREDVAFLRESLTDDFVGIGPLGFMLTKDQWLGRYEGGLSYDSFALDEIAVRFYGDAAVATCRQSQSGEFRGNDASGEFRATLIFAEQEGRWLLAGLHLSPIAGAPSFLDR
jgi:ketosteroid isomerase-like protein